MKIYLVQHGEAAAKEVDPERPLTAQGLQDVKRIAKTLKHAGVKPERVIHSGKLRARQTAEILAGDIASEQALQTSDLIQPNDDPVAFTGQIDGWDGDTIVIGHLPFMQKLVAQLVTGDDSRTLVAYRPGSVVCLESGENDKWQIHWMLRPELVE